jgi:MFS family permease
MNNVARLKLSKFLWGLAFYTPIVTLYFLQHKVSLPAIVLSQVFYSIFSLIGDVPTGILADKLGKRQALVLGYMFNVLGLSAMLFMPNVTGLFVTYSMLGFGDSFLSGSEEALMYESSENQKEYRRNYGSLLANETLAFAAATFIAGIVVSQAGQPAYRVLISFTLIADVLAAFVTLGIHHVARSAKGDGQEHASNLGVLKQAFGVLRESSIIRALTIVSLLTLSGEYFLYSVYQPYFQHASVPALFLGLVLSLGALLNYVVLRYGYVLEKVLSLEKILLLLNSLMGFAYIAMAVFVSPIALVPLFILLKGLFNSQAPIVSDYVNENTPGHIRATVLSMMSVVRTIGQILARILLAVAVGAIGISTTFKVQGAYMLVGIAFGYWLLVKCGCTHRIHEHHEQVVVE